MNEANFDYARIKSKLPSPSRLLEKILPFHGTKGYEIVPADNAGREFGNHGDLLMYQVFRKILSEANIMLVQNPEEADFLFVRPNGALLESYQFPDILAQRLRELPDIPLVIFPSSALFPTIDPSFMFDNRDSSTLWIFRESYSFKHITKDWSNNLQLRNVELFLDHDVVASGHEFTTEIVGEPLSSKHILIAARIDSEAASAFSPSKMGKRTSSLPGVVTMKKAILKLISDHPDAYLSRVLSRSIYRNRLTAAANDLSRNLPENVRNELKHLGLPFERVDLSSPIFVSYNEYKKIIRESAVVVTDRLHVALPAAISGKQVFLVEAGYHKLTGVYERSLHSLPNVTLINAYTDR